jgi:hypothetical protein
MRESSSFRGRDGIAEYLFGKRGYTAQAGFVAEEA